MGKAAAGPATTQDVGSAAVRAMAGVKPDYSPSAGHGVGMLPRELQIHVAWHYPATVIRARISRDSSGIGTGFWLPRSTKTWMKWPSAAASSSSLRKIPSS